MNPSELDSLNRQRLVARLLSATVHDARNALQGISGTAELIGMALTTGAGAEQRVQSILRQSAWLGGRLEQLLAMANETHPHPQRLEVTLLCREAVALRQASWGRQRITADIVTALPSVTAHADTTAALRMVLNLLVNAEQSLVTVGGGTIRLTLTADSAEVVVRVTDGGGGVSASEAACLFTTHTAGGRLATGLAASRLLAGACGGSLTWGGADHPSTFTLRLPSGG